MLDAGGSSSGSGGEGEAAQGGVSPMWEVWGYRCRSTVEGSWEAAEVSERRVNAHKHTAVGPALFAPALDRLTALPGKGW